MGVLTTVFLGYLLLRYRKVLGTPTVLTFCSLFAFPMIAYVVRTLLGLFPMFALAASLSLILFYHVIRVRQQKQYAQREIELMQMRTALMVGQMQPHFTHNVLSMLNVLMKKLVKN